jgi:uncharacterized protein (TIGR02996 family)
MTTEDDFQAKLDADPDDWQTRLVFADWLEERGDPRAEGYRALGVKRLRPNLWVKKSKKQHWWWGGSADFWRSHSDVVVLPRTWYEALTSSRGDGIAWPADDKPNTRRVAEDAAARAFGLLEPDYRTELLAPPPAPSKQPKKKPTKRRTRRK